MKTSNKLLIAFAASLILLPILCIAFVSSVYFEKGDESVRREGIDNFGAIAKNTVSITGTGSAETINIQGDNKIHLVITITKNNTIGVQTSDNLKGLVTVSFDADHNMQVVVKNSPKGLENSGRLSIAAPDVNAINVTGAHGIGLQAEMDALNLNLTNTEYVNFNIDTKVKNLIVDTKNVKEITFSENGLLSASLNLNNTNLKSDLGSFNDLTINATGNSNIELNGGDDQGAKRSIKNMKINTLGTTDLKVVNMVIDQCSGKFSDATTLQIPAININQMYNVKK